MNTDKRWRSALRRRARALADSGDRGSQFTEYGWLLGGLAAVGAALILAVTDVIDSLIAMLQSALP